MNRNSLFSVSKKILEDKGIKGLSMMKISKAAGVSEATLYKYFNIVVSIAQHWTILSNPIL